MRTGLKTISRSIVLAAWVCLLLPLGSQAAPSGKFTIDDAAFLAGCWQGVAAGADIRETYTAPKAGAMLGNSQLVSNGKTDFFEFIRLVQTADGVEYRPLPNGKSAASFTLVKASSVEVVFENPANDFPQRIAYTLDAARGLLTARIEKMDGSKAESFPMKAVSCGGEAHGSALRSGRTR